MADQRITVRNHASLHVPNAAPPEAAWPPRWLTAVVPDQMICMPLHAQPDGRPMPEGVTCTYIYTLTDIFTHGSFDLVGDHQSSFSIILVGNQIADSAWGLKVPDEPGTALRTSSSGRKPRLR